VPRVLIDFRADVMLDADTIELAEDKLREFLNAAPAGLKLKVVRFHTHSAFVADVGTSPTDNEDGQ
jgi:hypothetical protein